MISKKRIKRFHIAIIFMMIFSLVSPVSASTVQVAEDVLTVSEAIANNSGKASVKGYIVGTFSNNKFNTDPANFVATNIAIADSPDETDITKVLPVQLPNGAIRNALNLIENPELLGQEVIITGTLEKYFGQSGLKSPTDYQLVDGELPGDSETLITIQEARDQVEGNVKVKGIVTAKLKNTIHIQDETAAIAVRPTSLDVAIGDAVTVSGSLLDYNGLLQVDNAKLIEKEANQGVPAPLVIEGSKLIEENESKLVTIHNVTLSDAQDGGGWVNYTATDGTTFLVRDETDSLGLTVGQTYDAVTGIAQQFGDSYQLIPRGLEDIVEDANAVQSVMASPGSGVVEAGTEITLSTPTEDAEIYYTVDGTDPVKNGKLYNGPLVVEEDVTIKAYATKEGLSASKVRQFKYVVFTEADALQIHDIQGEGHVSPLKGQFVDQVEGIITYIYNIKGSNYFHMQTPDDKVDGNPNTSEGVVVYTGKKIDVAVGDLVRVSGKVDEYAIDGYNDAKDTDLLVTQINARDDQKGVVDILKQNVNLPKPIVIDMDNLPAGAIASPNLSEFDREKYAADFWESLEGMRVTVGNTKAVAPQEHGDLIVLLEEAKTDTINGGVRLTEDNQHANRIQFKLHPNNEARGFEVATGDTFEGPLTGVVNYGFQNYKIYADLADVQKAHRKGDVKPAVTFIEEKEDQLTVASYNLENFSNNKAANETPDAKAQKLARAFAIDMNGPDIVGVTEVQDNNGQAPGDSDASESYERLIREIEKAGGPSYEYVNINPVNNADGGAPNANIRVGFLYNPERVNLMEGSPEGTATEAVGYASGKLTLNPGRIEPNDAAFKSSRKPLAAQFEFKGESVVVVANHFNSKLGDTPLFGAIQPPVYGSQVQREKIATIINNFVKDVKADNPDENVIVLGDLNDFEFSKPLQVLKGNELTNMVEKVPAEQRYSYVYQGISQVLDHILVTNNLAESTIVDMLHINADFTDMAGRASDHDPVIIQIDFKKDAGLAPIEPEKTYNLKNFKTSKLTIHAPSISVSLDDKSVIKEGLFITGAYAEFHGKGFQTTSVTSKPNVPGAILDAKGTHMKELIIDGPNVVEIRGAENIQRIKFVNGAQENKIKIYDSKGEPIAGSFFISLNTTKNLTRKYSATTRIIALK